MGSDFYKRTKELFEEFQKRELHYLNTESIYSDQFNITSDINLPVEEYLQKLNKREKESEDTYRGLMTHMEELDRRTESISAKLAKLDSLRASMFLKFPTWSSSNNAFDQQYSRSSFNNTFDQQYPNYSHTPNTFQANQDFKYLSALKSNQDFEFPSTSQITQIKDSKCVATQTDHMFCENCQFPIAFASSLSNLSYPLSSAPESSTSLLQNTRLSSSIKADTYQMLNPPTDFVHQNINLSSNNLVQQNVSQTASQSHDCAPESLLAPNKEEDLKLIPPVTGTPILTTKETEIDSHTSDKNDRKTSICVNENTNAEAVAVNKTVTAITKDNDLVNERKPSIDETASTSDSVDKGISKSDDESLNHEFDFLDSDKRSQRRILQAKQEPPPQTSKNTTKNFANTHEALKNNQADNEKDKDNSAQSSKKISGNPTYDTKNTSEAYDKQSESSISIGGAHSPSLRSENLSAVSDSDSLYEKEDPHLKTSAAYQALLGNAPIAKTVQKLPYSESESEDEIEKALANTNKKNRKVSLNTASQEEKAQDNKKNAPESKPKMEPRKSISGGKSQQLSKNTRKVLGLDTSSGSEGEVKVEANIKKKIEEDSDEFDFYD